MLIMKNLLILVIVFLFISCNKNNPKPNEKFYCQIDGKAFRPNGNGDVFNRIVYAEWNTKGWFNVYGFDDKTGHSIVMTAKLNSKNEVELKQYSTKDSLYYATYSGDLIYNSKLDRKEHEEFSAYEGNIIVTKYEKSLKLASGTFEFKAKSKQTGNQVNVTKGQFNDVTVYQVY